MSDTAELRQQCPKKHFLKFYSCKIFRFFFFLKKRLFFFRWRPLYFSQSVCRWIQLSGPIKYSARSKVEGMCCVPITERALPPPSHPPWPPSGQTCFTFRPHVRPSWIGWHRIEDVAGGGVMAYCNQYKKKHEAHSLFLFFFSLNVCGRFLPPTNADYFVSQMLID